jgi:hypothetical protein
MRSTSAQLSIKPAPAPVSNVLAATAPITVHGSQSRAAQFNIPGRWTFGSDSPHWTISGSRREDVSAFILPGPGAYDPTKFEHSHQIPHVFSKINPPDPDTTITGGIDFIYHPIFPQNRPFHIGVRKDTQFAHFIETPGPNYTPRTNETRIPHFLPPKTEIREEKIEEVPGPGQYEPQFGACLTHEPRYSFSGPRKRSEWMIDRQGIPGPGRYATDLTETLPRVPHWTLGRRSRLSRQNRNEPPGKPKDLIAIAEFVIELNVMPNPEASRQYVVSHPDLRKIVHELLDAVFAAKPEAPLEFLQVYCTQSSGAGE